MIRFVVQRPLPRHRGSTRQAWLEFYRGELDEIGSSGERTLEELAPGRFRVETQGLARAGRVTVRGILTFDVGETWSVRSESEVGGRLYARERAHFHVRSEGGVPTLVATYELTGGSAVFDFALNEGRDRLRAERERSLDRFLARLEGT